MEVLIWTRCLNLLTCQFFQSTFLLGQQLTSHKKESASPTLVTLPAATFKDGNKVSSISFSSLLQIFLPIFILLCISDGILCFSFRVQENLNNGRHQEASYHPRRS